MVLVIQWESGQHAQIRANQELDLAGNRHRMSCLQGPSTWDMESGGFCLQSLTILHINIHPILPAFPFESQKGSMSKCHSALQGTRGKRWEDFRYQGGVWPILLITRLQQNIRILKGPLFFFTYPAPPIIILITMPTLFHHFS